MKICDTMWCSHVFIFLIVSTVSDDPTLAHFHLSNGADMWLKYPLKEMTFYPSQKTTDPLDITDHALPFLDTSGFYAVSRDNSRALAVLLDHGLLEKMSLWELIKSCISLLAFSCLATIFDKLRPDNDVILIALRMACIKRHQVIPFLLSRGGEMGEVFIRRYPNLLQDIYHEQSTELAVCSDVVEQILSSLPPDIHGEFLNGPSLRALTQRMARPLGWECPDEVCTKFYKDICRCLALMVDGKPELVQTEDSAIYHALVTVHHSTLNRCIPGCRYSHFVQYTRKLANHGFVMKCNHGKTGDCALTSLLRIYVFGRGKRHFLTHTDGRADGHYLYLFSGLLRSGCDPNFSQHADAFVDTDSYNVVSCRDPISQSARLRLLQELLRVYVGGFALARDSGLQMARIIHLVGFPRRQSLIQHAVSHLCTASIGHQDYSRVVHMCAIFASQTNFDDVVFDGEIVNMICTFMSYCRCKVERNQMRLGPGMIGLLAYFIILMDQKLRNKMAPHILLEPKWSSFVDAAEKLATDTVSKHLSRIQILLTGHMTLKESCILLIRKTILEKSEDERKNMAFHQHNKADRETKTEIPDIVWDDGHELTSDSECATNSHNSTITHLRELGVILSPIKYSVLGQLPIPRSFQVDISSIRHLEELLVELWSDPLE